jgi:hypothetical protein
VAIDIAGPFEKTPEGYTHFLLAVDETDGWVEIIELSSLEADEAIGKFLRVEIASNGVPDVILSDRGSAFTAEHANGVFEALGVDKKASAPRSLWGNGTAEASIKIAKRVMKKLAEELRERWNRVIWMVLVAMRSRTPEALSMSPFEARRGKKMVLPSSFSVPEGVEVTASQREMNNDKILKLRDEAAEKMKEKFDKGLIEKKFVVGQKIWIRNEEVTAANPKERIGPFEVVRITGPVDVEIKEVKNGPKLGTRHKVQSVRNLIEFTSPNLEPPKEFQVVDVVDHDGHGRGRKYRVRWSNGDYTWEPRANLVDREENGEEVMNEAFERYLERNQMLGKSRKR